MAAPRIAAIRAAGTPESSRREVRCNIETETARESIVPMGMGQWRIHAGGEGVIPHDWGWR